MATDALIQYLWTLSCAGLVLFMQAGFCALEAGSVRHKNSINVALKNIADLCCAFTAFFVIGFGLMFGATQGGLLGSPEWFLTGADADRILFFLFQATFCSTAATIVSGGVAERCRFLPYVVVSLVLSILIYPAFGHWVWNDGGWLKGLGYHDFAGSSVVHMIGAGVALAGIQVLGPRAGRFGPDGSPRTIPGANMPMVAIGVVILTFGWIGFNGGSAALGAETPLIVTNTLLAATFGGLVVMLLSWAYGGATSVTLVLNGILGGLVAITACADCVSQQASAIVGMAGGVAVVLATALLDRLRLDDAVGAVPVHGAAGIVGIMLTPAFASEAALADWGVTRSASFGVQAIGAGTCLAWSYLTGLIVWWVIGRVIKLRVGQFEEQVGLNYTEHQVPSPLHDLAIALTAASQGRADDAHRRLDNVGAGEEAQLAAAVRALIEHTERQLQTSQRLAGGLDELRARLGEQRTSGSRLAEQCQSELGAASRSLDRVLAFLDHHGTEHAVLPILGDLMQTLRQRLATVADALPSQQATWRGIDTAVASLDHLLVRLRRAGA